ncbi:MAG: hypothetical protein LBR73_06480 [Oscillospiraceae bacterium]|jgi:hypothetical protein|nr:hypothetical protein [Oscillospiraceae bacterium]
MRNKEIIEIEDFTLNEESFRKLTTALKEGKIVRNPFARLLADENAQVELQVDQPQEQSA